jgi:hypothetical protein
MCKGLSAELACFPQPGLILTVCHAWRRYRLYIFNCLIERSWRFALPLALSMARIEGESTFSHYCLAGKACTFAHARFITHGCLCILQEASRR